MDNIEGGEKARFSLRATGTGKTYHESGYCSGQQADSGYRHNKTLAGLLYVEFRVFPITRWNISVSTVITGLRPMCLPAILISERIARSMMRLIKPSLSNISSFGAQ